MRTIILLPKFKEMLEYYQLTNSEVHIESDIQGWEHKNGLNEDDPNRLAITVWRTNSKIPDFIIKNEILETDKPTITGGMFHRGNSFHNQLNPLKKFIIHTMLHEIAHGIGIKGEYDADEWAWKELGKWFINE